MDFYKEKWGKFYIRKPFARLWWRVKTSCAGWVRRITGRWWCEECGRYHGRRVIAYYTDGETGNCFKGMEDWASSLASETGEPDAVVLRKLIAQSEYIGSGRRNVTLETKRAYERKCRDEEKKVY